MTPCPQCGYTFGHDWTCPRKEVDHLDKAIALAGDKPNSRHEARVYLRQKENDGSAALEQRARELMVVLSCDFVEALAYIRATKHGR